MRFYIFAMIMWVLLFTSIVFGFLVGGGVTYLGFIENRVSLLILGPAQFAFTAWIIYRDRKTLYSIWREGF
jgi:flagellar motor component MotA